LYPSRLQILPKQKEGLPLYYLISQATDFGKIIEHTILAMITSQKNEPWPLDVVIKNKKLSGLAAPSVVRMKLFTLDNRFILREIGHLSKSDQTQVKKRLLRIFDYLS
jgi:mRNA interferase MazF